MLRKALPQDLGFVFELYMHPAVNPYLLYEPMDQKSFAPIYNDLLEKGVKYIYMDDETAAGMVKIIPYTYRSAHIAYIGGLAVHPGFAGKGHGKQLMRDIIKEAGRRKFRRLELSVSVANEKAISLYLQAGFKKEGILEKYTYLKEKDAYLDEVLMAYLFK